MSDFAAHKPKVLVVIIIGDEQYDVGLFCCPRQGD
jgi:hypothetical protein